MLHFGKDILKVTMMMMISRCVCLRRAGSSAGRRAAAGDGCVGNRGVVRRGSVAAAVLVGWCRCCGLCGVVEGGD